MRRGMVL